jgi:hypothetical protein
MDIKKKYVSVFSFSILRLLVLIMHEFFERYLCRYTVFIAFIVVNDVTGVCFDVVVSVWSLIFYQQSLQLYGSLFAPFCFHQLVA